MKHFDTFEKSYFFKIKSHFHKIKISNQNLFDFYRQSLRKNIFMFHFYFIFSFIIIKIRVN